MSDYKRRAKMKALAAVALLAVAMLGLSGCIFIADGSNCGGDCWNKSGCSKGIETKSPEIVELRQLNQSVISSRLNIGMAEPEVRAAFVDRVARGELGKDRGQLYVNNPYRTETVYCQEQTAKVLWYYSAVRCDNGQINNDELTPVLFVDGKLVGWGQRFYDQYCKKTPAPQPPKA
jgi:hypothetical protein